MDIILLFLAKPLDKHGTTLVHITNPPLDISKAFDKVWQEGLVFKLKTYGISGPLLALIVSYISNRQQSVVLNRKTSLVLYISGNTSMISVPTIFLFDVY